MDLKQPGWLYVPPSADHPHMPGSHQKTPCRFANSQKLIDILGWSHSTADRVFLTSHQEGFSKLWCTKYLSNSIAQGQRVIWFTWGNNQIKRNSMKSEATADIDNMTLRACLLDLNLLQKNWFDNCCWAWSCKIKDVHASCKRSHRTLWLGLTYLATWGFHSRALHTPCTQGQCIHLTTSVNHLPGQWE